MKKTILFSACAALSLSMVACGGNPNKAKNAEAAAETKAEAKAAPVYNVIDKPQVDLATLPVDKEGYYVIFDGKTFNGWRGYGKDNVPAKWTIDDGAIKFNGTGGGEAQKADGGDLIFAHKFKNFELELEWKISKGGNSGILYLAQEVEAEKNGQMKLQPIYISSPEYQVLDNENHPDAKLGVDGNRKVGVALRHDPRRAAERQALRRVEQGEDHGLQGYGRSRPERSERRGVPPLDAPVDGDARKQQVLVAEVAARIRAAQQLRRREPRGVHRFAGSRRRRLVPQHPRQGARLNGRSCDETKTVYSGLLPARCGDAPFGGIRRRRGKGPKKEVGIQLYSVRSLIGVFGKSEGDYKPVLQALADMGYTFVEAASYKDGLLYGTPQQFRRDVEATGMKVLSTHCTLNLSDKQLATGDFTEALKWWDECIAAHKAAGVEYIVVPSMRRIETLDGLATYCRYFNEVGARCKAAGIKFGYHNHSREFEKVEDRVMLDYMLENTDPDKVFFQMDVYWTVMGQASPVDYFTKYPGRFRLLHIKDRREVGQSGMVGYDAIFRNAATAGVENIIVEMEGSSYGDVLRSVRECVDYLNEAPFVEASYAK